MAIPSEQDFCDTLTLLHEAQQIKTLPPLSQDRFFSSDTDDLIKSLESALDEHWSVFFSQKLSKSPAYKWLFHNWPVLQTYENLKNGIKTTTKDIATRIHSDLFSKMLTREQWTEEKIRGEIEYGFGRHSFDLGFLAVVLPAYVEYFYFPGAAEAFIEEEKEIPDLIKDISTGQKALTRLLAIARGRAGVFHEEINRTLFSVTQVLDVLNDPHRAGVPISNKNRTARERLLIWRLYLGLNRIFGKAPPSVIKDLLQAEGIKNRQDDRNIDAVIKEYRSRLELKPHSPTSFDTLFPPRK